LGRLALRNILPAFAQIKHTRLTGLVSGDPEKMRVIAAQDGVPREACYGYGEMARLRGNAAVQVVYVVLPNSLHRDAVIQAAEACKHVLCEKPMATSPDEAREMIEACRRADRKPMIAYRCQYELAKRELARRARGGELVISRRDGEAAAKIELNVSAKNQFSLEMDHMAFCVRNDVEPRSPGEEGLRDQILMAAIYRSAQTGQAVSLEPVSRPDAFRGPSLTERST